MASSAIQSAGKWLAQLLVKEVKSLSAVKEKVEEVQSELEWMQCFLLDADGMQYKDALIQKWVSEISELALEAEDLTETYILKVTHKRQDGVLNYLKWLACFWQDAKTLHLLGSQIDGLTRKISKLTTRLQTYGVRSSYIGQSSGTDITKQLVAEQRRTYSHAQPNLIVGLERDVAKLVKQLQQGSQKIVVAHGMGGIGKTALAREVYRKCLSQGHFVGCAWAYVSQQCHLEVVLKELLNDLIPKDDRQKKSVINDSEASQLPGRLFEILKRNKYLIVLDDVWTVRDWKRLEPAFPILESSCGSKILVTTRNPQIFSNLGPDLVSTWKAETLKENSCWELLENKGHFKRNALDSPMKEVAQKMLDHCNGNPLAIVALGGVLATKKSREEWESVYENLQAYLQGDEESYNGVYDVLAMSYYDLHYNLKPCFLHMGHFPEDAHIDVEKLYDLWIADGIVQAGKKTSLESIADNYLNQLVQKGMIQLDGNEADGSSRTCSLHDLMRDYCLEKAREENFLKLVNIDDNGKALPDSRTDRARRLTMYVGKEDNQSILNSLLSGSLSSLRSLLFISTCAEQDRKEDSCEWIKTICQKFKLLRVLDFEGGIVLKGPLPCEVGLLIYLRYLCLRGTRIDELPSSIRNLKFLLLLDLRVRGVIIKLPKVLWEMNSLCCLYFPDRILSQESDNTQGYKTENGLLVLDNFCHLEKVRNVDLDNVDVERLLKLTSIRKVSAFCEREKESIVPILKSLTIKHLELIIDANLLIGEHEYLLSEATSLRSLHISAKKESRTQLPIRIGMFPSNLVELGFWYCKIKEDPMPVLEMLPKLRTLQLHACYDGAEMNCVSDKGFPELTSLELDGLFNLEEWNVKAGGFPKLQKLEIYNCQIKEIPEVLPRKVHISCSKSLQPYIDIFRRKCKAFEEDTQAI